MRVWTITLCFTNPKIIRQSIAQYKATVSGSVEYEHVLVHQHYPLPTKQEVSAEIKAIASDFNCTFLDPGKNLGLHDGFNWACNQLPLGPDDIIIGYDPDSWISTPGWDSAIVKSLQARPSIAWASLMNIRSEQEIAKVKFDEFTHDGVRLYKIYHPVVNSVCAIRWSFLKEVGGFIEPVKYYGHLETAMWYRIQKTNNEWVYLPDYKETDQLRDMHDPEYMQYKFDHAHRFSWAGDFESWLKEKFPDKPF